MSNGIEKKDLGYLGIPFQFDLVHCFLTEKEYFRDIFDIIEPNSFTQPQLRTIVGIVKDYFNKTEQVPQTDIIECLIRDKFSNKTEIDILIETLEEINDKELSNATITKEFGLKFFKQQNIVKTANQIIDIASKGINLENCDKYVEMLTEALNKGVHNDYGVNITDDIEDTLAADYRETIPTGIEALDQLLEGGIGKGELGVIACPSGFGKTSLTTAMASFAALQGKKVVQIVFEDTIKQIRRKHIARYISLKAREKGLGVVEVKDLSKEECANVVNSVLSDPNNVEELRRLNTNIRILRFPSSEMTVVMLGRFLRKLVNSGFKPDLCIIDYFECLNHDCFTNVSNEYEKEGRSMRKLEALAGELNIAVWTPSQGSKESFNAELLTIDKMGGSVKKAQIAHIILSITRTTEDIANNIATIALLKNRAGQSGKIFENVEFNNGTCIMSTENAEENSTSSFMRKTEDKTVKNILKTALRH